MYFNVTAYDTSYSSPYNAAQTMCQHILYMLHLQVIPCISHKKNFEYKVRKVSTEIGSTHNLGSSLRVWLATLPDQHLARPCLAQCVLAIALGSVVSGVNSSVQVQCVVAFKTYSVELLSSKTLVCVLVNSCLR